MSNIRKNQVAFVVLFLLAWFFFFIFMNYSSEQGTVSYDITSSAILMLFINLTVYIGRERDRGAIFDRRAQIFSWIVFLGLLVWTFVNRNQSTIHPTTIDVKVAAFTILLFSGLSIYYFVIGVIRTKASVQE